MNINGNATATLQVKESKKNEIGESVLAWSDVLTLPGWLDLSAGDSEHTNFNAKVQESTHIFLCDYQDLGVTAEDSRMIIDRMIYEILLIDNPMERNEHLEIYLKCVGFYFAE